MKELEIRRTFLVVSGDEERAQTIHKSIEKHFRFTQIFHASDGKDALFKFFNVPPHVLMIDLNISKTSGREVVKKIIEDPKAMDYSIIVMAKIPDKEEFIEDLITGRVQFLEDIRNDKQFAKTVTNALNRIEAGKDTDYHIKFIPPNQVLMEEGDTGGLVYIVKSGNLKAYKNTGEKRKELGQIGPGEFVGEMAHFNHEPRSATVESITDCELIEIPDGKLDHVLFTKPAWAKALVSTLSRRLKSTNELALKEKGSHEQ